MLSVVLTNLLWVQSERDKRDAAARDAELRARLTQMNRQLTQLCKEYKEAKRKQEEAQVADAGPLRLKIPRNPV